MAKVLNDTGYKAFDASGDIPADRFVKLTGDKTVTLCDAGDTPIGSSFASGADGKPFTVKMFTAPGTHLIEGETSFAFDGDVYVSNDGKASSVAVGDPVGKTVATVLTAGQFAEIAIKNVSSGGGSALTVKDDTVTVNNVTTINFTESGSVTDAGSGVVDVDNGGNGTAFDPDTILTHDLDTMGDPLPPSIGALVVINNDGDVVTSGV